MSLILWSQILLRNSSENFRSDISHPYLVLKSDKENSDHILSGIRAISEVQRIRLNDTHKNAVAEMPYINVIKKNQEKQANKSANYLNYYLGLFVNIKWANRSWNSTYLLDFFRISRLILFPLRFGFFPLRFDFQVKGNIKQGYGTEVQEVQIWRFSFAKCNNTVSYILFIGHFFCPVSLEYEHTWYVSIKIGI